MILSYMLEEKSSQLARMITVNTDQPTHDIDRNFAEAIEMSFEDKRDQAQ